MSYALPGAQYGLRRAGLGDVPSPGPTAFQGMTNGGALGFATKSILSDPSLSSLITPGASGFPALSPFSVINLSTLQTAFTNVLETGIEKVSDAVIAVIPDTIMSTVSDLVGEVMQAVPLVGPILKGILDAVAQIVGTANQSYTGSQQEQQDCQTFFSYFKIMNTGGGSDPCTACPSDIFFPSVATAMTTVNNPFLEYTGLHTLNPCGPGTSPAYCASFKAFGPLYAWNIANGEQLPNDFAPSVKSFNDLDFWKSGPNWEASYSWRPAIGQALMLATEGSAIDAYEITDPGQRVGFQAWQNAAYDAVRGGYYAYLLLNARPTEAVWWQTYGGVPPARRAQFQALRRGMQAASKWYGSRSDAGISLWPIYMDLLLDSLTKGQINPEFLAFCLTYQWVAGAVDRTPIVSQGAGLVDSTRSPIDKSQMGMLVNQNWFGRGYVFFKSKAQAGTAVMSSSVCAQNTASQIMNLLAQWQNTTQYPATAAGAAKLAQYAEQAKADLLGGGNVYVPIHARLSWGLEQNLLTSTVPTVKKAHGSAALLGAAAAAAAIYLLL